MAENLYFINSYAPGKLGLVVELLSLGLDQNMLESLRGERVLDLGCGKEAHLVHYLRELGIDAEGIDPALSQKNSFLMKRAVTYSPFKRPIPREAESYKLVLALGNPVIYDLNRAVEAMKAYAGYPRILGNLCRIPDKMDYLDSKFMIEESLRVLRSDGKMIIAPGLKDTSNLENLLENTDYTFRNKPAPRITLPKKYINSQDPRINEDLEKQGFITLQGFGETTVIECARETG